MWSWQPLVLSVVIAADPAYHRCERLPNGEGWDRRFPIRSRRVLLVWSGLLSSGLLSSGLLSSGLLSSGLLSSGLLSSGLARGLEHRRLERVARRLAGPDHELERRIIALAGIERGRQQRLALPPGCFHAAGEHERVPIHHQP